MSSEGLQLWFVEYTQGGQYMLTTPSVLWVLTHEADFVSAVRVI